MPTQYLRLLVRNLAETDKAGLATFPTMISTSLNEANLLRPTLRQRTARTSGLATQNFILTLAAPATVNCVGFTRHNWTTASLMNIRLQGAGSPTIMQNHVALPGFSSAGLSADLDDYTEAGFDGLRSTMKYLPPQPNVDSVGIDIADAANPDGYIEQTRLWVGKYFQVAINPAHGQAELEFVDSTKASRVDDGSSDSDWKHQFRRLTINLEWIAETDIPAFLALMRYLGVNRRECFVSLFPEEGGALELYNQMACRMTAAPKLGHPSPGMGRSAFVFEET